MKTIYKPILTTFLLSLVLIVSCTDKFEELNIDKRRVTDEQLKADYYFVGGFFPQMQQMIYCNFNWGWGTDWPFQVMQNLHADIYSGYLMTPTPFKGNLNNTTYFLIDDWNGSLWDYTYAYFMTVTEEVKKIAKEEYPDFYAISLILKVQAMHRVSDIYGPIIYTHYAESTTGGQFDSQKEAYYAFFEDLNTAVNLLQTYITENPNAKPFNRYDQFFEGDYAKWIKYANSLRLRLAIHIANVEPIKAKSEAEAAMANSYGVFETEIAQVSGKGYTNPLNVIANGWGDIRMGAVMESILLGYNDPRAKLYFKPTADADIIGSGYDIKGIRQGIELTDKTVYLGHSSVNIKSETPGILLTAAEVYFLRAEGAVRGWSNMGGTAQELYEDGIKASMDQWGAAIGPYLSNTNIAAPYEDVKRADNINNIDIGNQYITDVSPMWDNGAPDNIKLAKIAVQKWIALFPEGIEAWTEVRRSGYPKIFPVVVNNSGGIIATDHFIRRINFSATEKNTNPTGYANAVIMLGGPDNGATPLWWDID